ncbi:penicillin-insensitive murein endopeptidase [Zobellella aerophila]|uniref:Penicillin-insensitive murein endopeptidase n=1 Tax=Zobellella aerophila TaxID=870480 RepID=A0ABP6VCP2_9GAMM
MVPGLLIAILWLPMAAWSQAVGEYAAGCQHNASALPDRGPGYYVIRRQQARYYGQPEMIRYLQDLGKKIVSAGLPPMLVADIAKRRGGPFAYGHRSHQTGLDADIWLRHPPPNPASERLATITAVDMVDHRDYYLTGAFTDHQRQLIALAAEDERVSRVFVHPLIKQAMCRAYRDADWQGRIRPWFGHSSHFHVRLHCPAGHHDCVPQAPVPRGSGCGHELAGWLQDRAGEITVTATAPWRPRLPRACAGWAE